MKQQAQATPLIHLFWIFLKLGCTSFGGPVAHIGFFHLEFVKKRRWYDEQEYLQLVALCQFLPGPASSQVGMAIGYKVRGYLGSLVSFLGFTLPSALLMTLFAVTLISDSALTHSSIFYMLKLFAVAVVLHAICNMLKAQLNGYLAGFICIASTVFALVFSGIASQIVIISLAGLVAYLYDQKKPKPQEAASIITFKEQAGFRLIISYALLLLCIPMISEWLDSNAYLELFAGAYQAGALVFGGGHVVLPLLETKFVAPDLINPEQFLAGYSLAQAIPGPLFTFASYLGALFPGIPPIWGAILASIGIFLPGYLLVIGLLPYWQSICESPKLKAAIQGINSSVIGLLIATFISPVVTHSIHSITDISLALVLFICLYFAKLAPYTLLFISLIAALIFDYAYF